MSVGSKMSDKRRTLEYDGITGANTANVSAYLWSPSEYQCLLRNRQHQPIAVINVQQRLQYSSPSSQRSVSVSATGDSEAQQSAFCGRSTYDSEVTRTGIGSKYSAGLRTSKAVQSPRGGPITFHTSDRSNRS